MLTTDANAWLDKAINDNDGQAVLEALSEGARIERATDGMTPLIRAARLGHADVAMALLSAGANANAIDRGGDSALHWFAGAEENLAAVEALLDAGADINARDGCGATPISSAVYWKSKDIVETLIRRGADIAIPYEYGGRTPLHVAAAEDAPEIAELLVKAGAQLDAVDNDGRTPLDVATGAARNVVFREVAAREGAELQASASTPQAASRGRRI